MTGALVRARPQSASGPALTSRSPNLMSNGRMSRPSNCKEQAQKLTQSWNEGWALQEGLRLLTRVNCVSSVSPHRSSSWRAWGWEFTSSANFLMLTSLWAGVNRVWVPRSWNGQSKFHSLIKNNECYKQTDGWTHLHNAEVLAHVVCQSCEIT